MACGYRPCARGKRGLLKGIDVVLLQREGEDGGEEHVLKEAIKEKRGDGAPFMRRIQDIRYSRPRDLISPSIHAGECQVAAAWDRVERRPSIVPSSRKKSSLELMAVRDSLEGRYMLENLRRESPGDGIAFSHVSKSRCTPSSVANPGIPYHNSKLPSPTFDFLLPFRHKQRPASQHGIDAFLDSRTMYKHASKGSSISLSSIHHTGSGSQPLSTTNRHFSSFQTFIPQRSYHSTTRTYAATRAPQRWQQNTRPNRKRLPPYSSRPSHGPSSGAPSPTPRLDNNHPNPNLDQAPQPISTQIEKDPRYKALSRKWTSLVVAIPFALYTSWLLYDRCELENFLFSFHPQPRYLILIYPISLILAES